MKLLLMKIIKCKALLIVLSAVLIIIITLLIVFGPKRLASKVNPNGIAYVIAEPTLKGENSSGQYIIDDQKDIQKLSKMIKKAIYIKWYNKHLINEIVFLEIHYHDGTITSIGPYGIFNGDDEIQMIVTSLDFNSIFEMAGLYGQFALK